MRISSTYAILKTKVQMESNLDYFYPNRNQKPGLN